MSYITMLLTQDTNGVMQITEYNMEKQGSIQEISNR